METGMNWFLQIVSIAWVSLRTIPQRLGASVSAAVGIGGVVAVLVGVLAIAQGFRKAMTASGSPDVAVVFRSGADSEMTSGLTRDDVRLIKEAPGISRSGGGVLASAELFVIINLPKRSTGTDANVPLRGVEPTTAAVRGNIELVKGRMFEPGKNEIIVGSGAARAFAGLDFGKQIKIGQLTWDVVGVFTAGGGLPESEIWVDAPILQAAYNRQDQFQAVYARLNSAEAFSDFKDALTTNPQLKVKALRLSEFYADQSEMLTQFVTTIGVFITTMMSAGALFGALNTMYSAVSARTREISTLRALGFGAGPVMASVLAESVLLALCGGAVGAAGAYLAFNGYQAETVNWQSFSQVTFAFAVTPALLTAAVLIAALLGFIGGFFPALRAARMPVASGLREV
ncbi:MAG: FtsX-like permease family protein [Verrucomicrobiales bacterium]|nr:FtsX-like permease family protein [Verrucomicrobiales bacterium]